MHRPGADMLNAEPQDFICDFCHSSWSEDRPMIEGHRGSLICGPCLSMACREVLVASGGAEARNGVGCALCLQTNPVKHWVSPIDDGVVACRECIERSARLLSRDKDSGWRQPTT